MHHSWNFLPEGSDLSMVAMKEAMKVFLAITCLLLGIFLVHDGMGFYSNDGETLCGILIIAAGLTVVWIRYAKSRRSA
jgi:hypothetical protein